MYGLKPVRRRRNDALTRVRWDQLEVLLADWYRGQGYEVDHTGTAVAKRSQYDGGIDLKLRRPGEYVLVQVKHWNADQVPHNEVHQLLGLMVNEGATGAILITSGEFTRAAIEAATRHGHVRLIDGDELRAMLGPLPEPPASQVAESFRKLERDFYGVLLLKGALVVAAMFLVFSSLNHALHGVGSLQPSARATASPKQPVLPVPTAMPSPIAARMDSCREVIDRPSDAYSDHCAQAMPKPPTAAETRAAQRKADEAMKVLAPNTPEM